MNQLEMLERILERLDDIDDKLDNQLERVSKAETNIHWLQGSVKVVVTMILSALAAAGTYILNTIAGKN